MVSLTGGRYESFFTVLYIAAAFAGAIAEVPLVWYSAEVTCSLMLFLNLFAIVCLLPLSPRDYGHLHKKIKDVAMHDTMRDTINFPLHFPVACHTDNVGPGSTFVAIQGMSLDGVQFIPEAIKRGATTIVLEHNAILPTAIAETMQKNAVRIERVDNARLALAQLSAHAAGYPAKKLRIIGITGTKGKTTTTFLLEHLFKTAGYKTALISSIKNSINGNDLPTPFATPLPDYLHQFLSQCVNHDVEIVLMEVAAQAVSLHRVEGIEFDGLIFTNFSLEHLEFYASMETYFDAKSTLFKQATSHAPLLINADDTYGQTLLAAYPDAFSFGMTAGSTFKGNILSTSSELALHITHDEATD